MNQSFYTATIFFLGLGVIAGLVQSLLYFQVGAELPALHSFADWFLTVSLISLMSTGFILRYYYRQHYRVAFWMGLIALAATVCRATLAYIQLVPLASGIGPYYFPASLLELSVDPAYAVSLILSRTSQKPWLRRAGYGSLVLGLAGLGLAVWALNVPMPQLFGPLQKFNQWISLVGSCLPLLFILHFQSEQPRRTNGVEDASGKTVDGLVDFTRAIAVGALLFLGMTLASEAVQKSHISAKTRALAQLFDARTYVGRRGDTLHYRLLKPLNYNPAKRYPLVVSLHSGAGYGTDNLRQLDSWEAQNLADSANRKKYPAFVFAPQCTRGSSWGGAPRLTAMDTLVFDALKALETEVAVDTSRRYVLGGSLGGYGTWYFIGTRPDYFAAAMPICGAGDPALASRMTGVAVWAFHGEKDHNVPVEGSRNLIAGIRKAGGHPRYSEFPGAGHNITREVHSTPGVFDWLFAQHRN